MVETEYPAHWLAAIGNAYEAFESLEQILGMKSPDWLGAEYQATRLKSPESQGKNQVRRRDHVNPNKLRFCSQRTTV